MVRVLKETILCPTTTTTGGWVAKSAYCVSLLLPPPFFKPHLVRLIFTNVIQFFLKRLPNLRLPPAFKIT